MAVQEADRRTGEEASVAFRFQVEGDLTLEEAARRVGGIRGLISVLVEPDIDEFDALRRSRIARAIGSTTRIERIDFGSPLVIVIVAPAALASTIAVVFRRARRKSGGIKFDFSRETRIRRAVNEIYETRRTNLTFRVGGSIEEERNIGGVVADAELTVREGDITVVIEPETGNEIDLTGNESGESEGPSA